MLLLQEQQCRQKQQTGTKQAISEAAQTAQGMQVQAFHAPARAAKSKAIKCSSVKDMHSMHCYTVASARTRTGGPCGRVRWHRRCGQLK